MADVVKRHKEGLHPSFNTSESGWLTFANSKLALLRFEGTDQNPHGIRDIFMHAETVMRQMEQRIAILEKQASDAGWRETMRQQERSGGTM